ALVVIVVGGRVLWTRRGCAVTAVCAAIMVAHLLMLALLVRSYPINFTPLHTVFGLCVAAAGEELYRSRAAARLRFSAELGHAMLTAALAAPFAVSCVQTGRILLELPAPFNLHAERELMAHLTAVDPGDGKIHTVSTEDLMTGVVSSLSEGRIRVAEAQDYLIACHRGRAEGEGSAVAACLSARFRRLLEGLHGNRPLRFVLPADIQLLPHVGDAGPDG